MAYPYVSYVRRTRALARKDGGCKENWINEAVSECIYIYVLQPIAAMLAILALHYRFKEIRPHQGHNASLNFIGLLGQSVAYTCLMIHEGHQRGYKANGRVSVLEWCADGGLLNGLQVGGPAVLVWNVWKTYRS